MNWMEEKSRQEDERSMRNQMENYQQAKNEVDLNVRLGSIPCFFNTIKASLLSRGVPGYNAEQLAKEIYYNARK